MSREFGPVLLDWFSSAARDLPWRRRRDPYAIWISEIMLQQTRVETVIPYFERWMARFPDIRSLAQAPIDHVLAVWEGLGYYQRAHNLHRMAKILMDQYQGEMPSEVHELRTLPGIGPYTANAIAAIAFDQEVIALDGNLRRVSARLFCFEGDPAAPRSARELSARMLKLMPKAKAAAFNQALMDLGAEVCTPRSPSCDQCPVERFCEAKAAGKQDQIPRPKKAKKVPHHTLVAGVLQEGDKVLLARRPDDQLLGGLWEFPGGRCRSSESMGACLRRTWRKRFGVKLGVDDRLEVVSHAYSHYTVSVHAYRCRSAARIEEGEGLRWVPLDQLSDYPMGKVDRAIALSLGRQRRGNGRGAAS